MKTRKIAFIFLHMLLFFVAGLHLQAQQDSSWQYIGGQGISEGKGENPVVAVTPDGTIYCAYRDFVFGKKISIKRFDGTGWGYIPGSPGFSPCSAIPSMISGPAGSIYLAYVDSSLSYKSTVKKFDGTQWEVIGIEGFSPAGVADVNLALSPAGQLFISFLENYGSSSVQMSVMKFDNGIWEYVGTPGQNDGYYGTSLAVDSLNHPYISFRGYFFPSLEVLYFNGTEWIDLTPFYPIGYTISTSLSFDSSNYINVACNSSSYSFEGCVFKHDGVSWHNVGPMGFTPFEDEINTLKLSPSGEIYFGAVGYNGVSWGASVMKFSNGYWSTVGPFGFTYGAPSSISLSFDESDCPIAGINEYNNNQKVSVMRFAATPVNIKITESNDINLYPSPAKDKLFITINNNQEQILDISIIGLSNNIKFAFEEFQNKVLVNIGNLPDGMYVVKILTNKKLLIKKFIKG